MAAVQEDVGFQWLPDMESLKQELQKQDATVLSVAVALLAVLITLVLWKLLKKSQTSRRAILLVGLCDSGKTLLFCRLLTGKFRKTQTSITGSSAVYKLKSDKGSSFTLVDVPGHESLRLQYLDQYKTAASLVNQVPGVHQRRPVPPKAMFLPQALVFMVDSSAFQRDVKEVAEFLYQILTDATFLRNAPPILFACNKQDISMAKSAKLIQQQLEKELNTLRVTQSAAPSTLDSSSSPATMQLGKKGKDFDFSQLPMKVEFLECSARDSKEEEGDANISNIEGWLAKLV